MRRRVDPSDPIVPRERTAPAGAVQPPLASLRRCAGAGTRTTQLFFNLQDNKALDKDKFAPIGKVISGWEAVDHFYSGYGDWPPRGNGPDPAKVQAEGNSYLEARFPRLDSIKKASVQ